jgi:hypothetical protein
MSYVFPLRKHIVFLLEKRSIMKWEYLTVGFDVTPEGTKPRTMNNRELSNWQQGPGLYEFINELGEQEWELVAHIPLTFTQSGAQFSLGPFAAGRERVSTRLLIQSIFKRPKTP